MQSISPALAFVRKPLFCNDQNANFPWSEACFACKTWSFGKDGHEFKWRTKHEE